MKSGQGLLVLGDQLFPRTSFAKFKGFPTLMVEDFGLCTHYRYHKKKLVLFLSAMRHFSAEMSDLLKIDYIQLKSPSQPDFMVHLKKFCKDHQVKELNLFQVSDKFFEKSLLKFGQDNKVKVVFHDSPSFMTSREQFKDYLGQVKKPFMKTFYERQRKRTQILMDSSGKPEGGQYSFDEDNRKPFKGQKPVPAWPGSPADQVTRQVIELVEKIFKEHPGSATDFNWPVTHGEADKWLKRFIKDCFEDFGEFEDAIFSSEDTLFHSLLSPLINMGLLTPDQVIDESLKAWKKKKLPLNSVEGFLRQVIGWREFINGVYQNFSDKQESTNFFGHRRKLNENWWTGKTGVPILDDTIKKANRLGYCHHIERLMVLSNIMLLSEVDPKNVHDWFMEMFVDSADWVMSPNVYGMGQFSDGGIFATKPYICGSAYLLKMSNYKKGPWCDEIDGLYWRFIKNKRDFLSKNPRLKMMVSSADKIKSDRWKIINQAAENFIQRNTVLG